VRTNDGNNGSAPNDIVAEVGSRVGTRNQLRQCRRDMPISSRQGGDADGHNENYDGVGCCTPEATRGGRGGASSSLAGVDFLLYKDSGRRGIMRLRMYGSHHHLIAVVVSMQVTQARRGMSHDFPRR